MSRVRAALFWSGGKDSALALDRIRRDGELEIVALVTTLDPEHGRVAMHGVPASLVEAQAEALGLELVRMEVRAGDDYRTELRRTFEALKARGVGVVASGDIFLADLRAWREERLAEAGLVGVFPLWQAATDALAREFVARGFRAVICCVEDPALPAETVGRDLDAAFLAALPPTADPCGENGEYHSFVYDGPGFARPVAFGRGEIVYRPLGTPPPEPGGIGVPAAPAGARMRGFWFQDLLVPALVENAP
jgi:uncharacterized protein (TIGR00290 family)